MNYIWQSLKDINQKRLHYNSITVLLFEWRGLDSNQRPSGYEPDELPTALSRDEDVKYTKNHQTRQGFCTFVIYA